MQVPFPAIELTALLGRGTRFEGKLHFEGRVRIDGTFQGEIRSDGTLVIGEGARVHADVYVGTLIVKGGTLAGLVQAIESIELHVPAQVTGRLTAPEIFMNRGSSSRDSARSLPRAKPTRPRSRARVEGPSARQGRRPHAGRAAHRHSELNARNMLALRRWSFRDRSP